MQPTISQTRTDRKQIGTTPSSYRISKAKARRRLCSQIADAVDRAIGLLQDDAGNFDAEIDALRRAACRLIAKIYELRVNSPA
jgi:hypothetical protein